MEYRGETHDDPELRSISRLYLLLTTLTQDSSSSSRNVPLTEYHPVISKESVPSQLGESVPHSLMKVILTPFTEVNSHL